MKSKIVKLIIFCFFVLFLCTFFVGIVSHAETLDPDVWKVKDGVTYRIVYDLSSLSEAVPIYYKNKYYPDVAFVNFTKFRGWDYSTGLPEPFPKFDKLAGVILREYSQNSVESGNVVKDMFISENDLNVQTYKISLTNKDGSVVYPTCLLSDGTSIVPDRSRFFRITSSTFSIDNEESSEELKIDFTTNFGADSSSPGSVTSPIDCSYIFDNNSEAQMKIDYQTNFDGYVTFYIVRESTANKPVNIANCLNGLYRNMQLDDSSGGVLLKYKQRLVNSAEFPGLVGDVGSILYKDKTLSDNYSKWYDPIPCISGTPYSLTYPASALSVNAGQKCALLVVCHPKDPKHFPVTFLQDLNEHGVTYCEYDGITKGGFYGFTMKNTVIANYEKAPYLPVDDNRIFSDDGSKIIDDKGGTGSDGRVIPPNATNSNASFYGVSRSAFDVIRSFLFIFPTEVQVIIIVGLTVALSIGILRLVTG